MRPSVDDIAAPPFPRGLPWIGVANLRMDQQLGRPVLVEFWDFCRPNSLRTLPYLIAWHERYEPAGLRVIGVHTSGFPPSADPDAVAAAVERLAIPYPVVVDVRRELWSHYGTDGWPTRYLFGPELTLRDLHAGEGGYRETELAIQRELGAERPPLEPLRPEDAPGVLLPAQSEDVEGAYSGPYAAGAAWAVLSGEGLIRVNGEERRIDHPGAHPLVDHGRHTEAVLDLRVGEGVTCWATCFTPGVP